MIGVGNSRELIFAETLKAVTIPDAWLIYSIVGIVLPLGYVMIKSKIVQALLR